MPCGGALGPYAPSTNNIKGKNKRSKMGIVKNIILLPFLPLRLAWKWTAGAEINGSQHVLAHLIGTVIVAGILYSLIGWGIMSLVDKFVK